MLTKFILLEVRVTAIRTFHLRDILIERVEKGIPLEHLGLHTFVAANSAIQLFAETVVDMQEPLEAPPMAIEEFFNGHGRIGYDNEIEFDDVRGSWYRVTLMVKRDEVTGHETVTDALALHASCAVLRAVP